MAFFVVPLDFVVPVDMADFTVFERDRLAAAVGVFLPEGVGEVALTAPRVGEVALEGPGFFAVRVVWLPPALLAPRSDRVGLAGMRPLARGVLELRLTWPARPIFSTENVLFRLLATLTSFPDSSSLLESSPRRALPPVKVD